MRWEFPGDLLSFPMSFSLWSFLSFYIFTLNLSLSLMTQPTSYKTPLDLSAKEAWSSAPVGDSQTLTFQVVAGCMPRSGSLFPQENPTQALGSKTAAKAEAPFPLWCHRPRSVGPQMTSEQTYFGHNSFSPRKPSV